MTSIIETGPQHAAAADRGEEDRALKTRQRGMWALGDYSAVATEIIAGFGPVLVEAAGIASGQLVLDVAAGSGNIAIPAARTGARVTASDLTPELLEVGRARAETDGISLAWETGDAEALPYADAQFDVVTSCVGAMFAPHHQPTADELVRVCKPGGTIALIAWTPAGFIGQMFATMKPYAPPPPPGAQPPPLWGDEAHVRGLLGDRVEILRTETAGLPVSHYRSGAEFRDYFKANYGPTIAAYRGIAGDPDKVAALDEALAELGDRFGAGTGSMEWEYLLLVARRR
jgi:ubiquinone/menaquinone biosynthesis C-methylase UbiE